MSAGGAVAAAATGSLLDFAGNSIMSNSANAKAKRATMTQFIMANYLMDKQNEYNKPINQMARLREAGLNPNLVYGDGGATIASASAGSVGAADVTPASGTLNVIGKMAALNSIKQQDANIAETEARTQAIDDNTELKRLELAETIRYNNKRLALLDAQIKHTGIQNLKNEAEIEYLQNKFDWRNPNDWKALGSSVMDIVFGKDPEYQQFKKEHNL